MSVPKRIKDRLIEDKNRGSSKISAIFELGFIALGIFVSSKIMEDSLFSGRFGNFSWFSVPIVSATITTVVYFIYVNRSSSILFAFFVGFGSSWLSSSLGFAIDRIIFGDIRPEIILNTNNSGRILSSIFFGPIVILSPLIGGAVLMIAQLLRKINHRVQ